MITIKLYKLKRDRFTFTNKMREICFDLHAYIKEKSFHSFRITELLTFIAT